MAGNKLILGIGPPKCGTTSLYYSLIESDEIAVPKLKEPRFFAKKNNLGLTSLPAGLELDGQYKNGIEWFNSLYSDVSEYRIDFTTYYSIIEETPDLIKENFDDVYAIGVFREPVDRFISHYYQYVKVGIDMPPIEEVISGSSDISKLMFMFNDYRGTVSRYVEAFGCERVKVLDFDTLKNNHQRVSDEITGYLGLKNFIYNPTTNTMNLAGVPRSKAISNIIFNRKLREISQHLSPEFRLKLLRLRKKMILSNIKYESYKPLADGYLKILKSRMEDTIDFYNTVVKCS